MRPGWPSRESRDLKVVMNFFNETPSGRGGNASMISCTVGGLTYFERSTGSAFSFSGDPARDAPIFRISTCWSTAEREYEWKGLSGGLESFGQAPSTHNARDGRELETTYQH